MGAKSVRATDNNPIEMSVPRGVAPPEDVTLPGIGPLEGSRDEGSVPPMGDLDARFFEMASDPFESADPASRRPLRQFQGPAAQRRERFVRFVAGAVALSAILCAAALVKRAVVATEGGAEDQTGAPRHAFAVAAGVAPVALRVAPVAPVAPNATGLPIAAAPAVVTSPPAPVQPAAPPVVEPGPASALEERGASRDALEHRKFALSIEAGERSVALDPTDAEAWLVLGAAYQERGQLGEARRCYKTCLVKATWGPRTECRELLR